MKLIEETLTSFSAKLNSKQPTPGGGSVAAYVSNLGSGLALMLTHLTVSKQNFLQQDIKKQQAFLKVCTTLNAFHD
ncbi:MAG: cyclodeaminase/cyclohydrolase family protein, partial [Bacilli bacterium]